MKCRDFEEGIATLAEGGSAPEAESHLADCPSCSAWLTELRSMIAASQVRFLEAPPELVACAKNLMPAKTRLVARLLGSSLLAASARSSPRESFSMRVEAEGIEIPLHFSPVKVGWEIMGRSPGEEWTLVAGENEVACGPGGRFSLIVPSLEESGFQLQTRNAAIEIRPARELLELGP